MKLFPGMTAYVTIPVADASSVLKVPNGALRFTPELKAADARAIAQKYGIRVAGARQNSNGTLSTGDVVTWRNQYSDRVPDLVWGTNAFGTIQSSILASPSGSTSFSPGRPHNSMRRAACST